MSNKIYFVEFDTKECRTIYNYVFHCIASNAKEAREKAREAWYTNGETCHMFHVYAKKSLISNPEYLRVRNCMGQEIKGADVLDRFILCDLKPWRVNGRKLYQ